MNLKTFFEASVSADKAGRVVEILKSYISRKTGQTIYDTKVLDHVIKDSGASVYGIFMMFDDGHHAFRINWATANMSAQVTSIDFWSGLSKNPQYTINTADFNIMEIVQVITDLLNNNYDVNAVNESQKLSAESIFTFLEGERKTFKNVQELLRNKGFVIEKDPAYTVRRYIVTNTKTKAKTSIRYIPIMDQMYNDILDLGIANFLTQFDANSQKSVPAVNKASREVPAPMESTPFDSLFEDPLNEEELFGLLDVAINNVKSGKSRTLLITGTPGVGKCVHGSLDVPVSL